MAGKCAVTMAMMSLVFLLRDQTGVSSAPAEPESDANLQSDERFLRLESSLKNIQETMTAFKANQQSSLTNIQASMSSFKAQFGDLHTRVLALEMKQKEIREEDRTENNAFREQLDEMETTVQPIAECVPCTATSISTGLMSEIMSTVDSRLEELSGAQGESSGAQGESSGAQGESSGAQGESSGAQGESSGAQGESSGAQGESSGAQGESSGAQGESSGAQSESSEEHENSSGEQLESNGGQDGSSPVRGTLIGTEVYNCQYQPLWTVDLAGTYTVSRVSILNKADCCETCGLSTFTHVPQSDCGDVDIANYEGVTLQFCADACCADTACVSFQHNIWSGCYLKHTICSAGEKVYSPGGHVYDRQAGTGQENFIVRVSPSETTDQNDQCGETYVETPLDGQTIVVHCNPPMSGRYVSVLVRTVPGGGLRYRLKLCMVEVYGTG
ncbi:uncharacterized protein LOC118413406 [Branchiostoma floridae]|uniref:Uncharacterized protein LOC118413406 n=1 Tax=Branchiostoma floridae TaxID=7739 RepID=A0A9J7KYI3_BRAFL|nr:uncharacterized protein LOC118413406 [Branchiostoma floridae]